MRLFVLFALTLAGLVASADDASAIGRRKRGNACCNTCGTGYVGGYGMNYMGAGGCGTCGGGYAGGYGVNYIGGTAGGGCCGGAGTIGTPGGFIPAYGGAPVYGHSGVVLPAGGTIPNPMVGR